jgi:hypothetical protein
LVTGLAREGDVADPVRAAARDRHDVVLVPPGADICRAVGTTPPLPLTQRHDLGVRVGAFRASLASLSVALTDAPFLGVRLRPGASLRVEAVLVRLSVFPAALTHLLGVRRRVGRILLDDLIAVLGVVSAESTLYRRVINLPGKVARGTGLVVNQSLGNMTALAWKTGEVALQPLRHSGTARDGLVSHGGRSLRSIWLGLAQRFQRFVSPLISYINQSTWATLGCGCLSSQRS